MAHTAIWKSAESAANYEENRPDYPKEVVDKSLAYLRENYDGDLTFAIDIGCGTGKSTVGLADHFLKVAGCEPSNAMLDQARLSYGHLANVAFHQVSAEDMSLFPDESAQLILASRCIHYFDHKLFFDEVKRILVPGGVLAFYTLQFEVIQVENSEELSQKATEKYDEYLEGWVGDCWVQPQHLPANFKLRARNRKEYYTEILVPPFPNKKVDIFETKRKLSLETLRNLLASYSATLTFRERHGDAKSDELLDKCVDNIKTVLGKNSCENSQVFANVMNEFYLVMSRKC